VAQRRALGADDVMMTHAPRAGTATAGGNAGARRRCWGTRLHAGKKIEPGRCAAASDAVACKRGPDNTKTRAITRMRAPVGRREGSSDTIRDSRSRASSAAWGFRRFLYGWIAWKKPSGWLALLAFGLRVCVRQFVAPWEEEFVFGWGRLTQNGCRGQRLGASPHQVSGADPSGSKARCCSTSGPRGSDPPNARRAPAGAPAQRMTIDPTPPKHGAPCHLGELLPEGRRDHLLKFHVVWQLLHPRP
jgi:hypothetical protein